MSDRTPTQKDNRIASLEAAYTGERAMRLAAQAIHRQEVAELEAENAKQKADHAAEAKRWEAEFNQQDAELERLRAENTKLRLKCRNSLANNLCPDHRDKQAGKPCLACEIESVHSRLDAMGVPPCDERIPAPDADGHCKACGLPWPDEKETMEPHECPPGFRPVACRITARLDWVAATVADREALRLVAIEARELVGEADAEGVVPQANLDALRALLWRATIRARAKP